MKREALLKLIEALPEESDILIPRFDECGLDDKFTVYSANVQWNVNGKSAHCGPYERGSDSKEHNAYIIN